MGEQVKGERSAGRRRPVVKPAFGIEVNSRKHRRNRMNRRPRRIKKCRLGCRRDPVQPIAKEALPLAFPTPGLYRAHGSYAGDPGTQYVVASRYADGEGADSEGNQHTTP